VIYSDGELHADEFSLDTAELLRDASPWGQGFPAPVFDGRFSVVSQRVVGERHLKLMLQPAQGNSPIDAIAFNTPALPDTCREARLAYRLDVNEYRGRLSPQLIVEHIETA
jgi:single-stranded-DNA-specific exonuclease